MPGRDLHHCLQNLRDIKKSPSPQLTKNRQVDEEDSWFSRSKPQYCHNYINSYVLLASVLSVVFCALYVSLLSIPYVSWASEPAKSRDLT